MALGTMDPGFSELVEAMKRTPRPLALLGAGASVDSGYPSWDGLLRLFRNRAKGKLGPKAQGFLDKLNDPAWQAEEYRRLLGEEEFSRLIEAEFAPKGGVGAVVHSIVRLGFRHILTTNYDSCVQRAFESAGQSLQVVDWTESADIRRFFLDLPYTGTKPYLVHLHGRFNDPANIILTESSYAKRYVRSDDAQRKLFAILITQPVVFIGFSVNDPDLNHLMREVSARLGTGNPQHFALLGYTVDEQRDLMRSRFQGKYGIRPVFYRITKTNGKEDHSDLRRLLEQLHGEISDKPVTREAQAEQLPADVPTFREESLSVGFEDDSADPMTDDDSLDQQKGRWGGRPETAERRLRVENVQERGRFLCEFDLVVETRAGAVKPLEGGVEFHLHQTFKPKDVRSKEAVNGEARLTLTAYGAFTVGVKADGGATRLELDLSQVEDFSQWFRER
jgi:hypothetical protein